MRYLKESLSLQPETNSVEKAALDLIESAKDKKASRSFRNDKAIGVFGKYAIHSAVLNLVSVNTDGTLFSEKLLELPYKASRKPLPISSIREEGAEATGGLPSMGDAFVTSEFFYSTPMVLTGLGLDPWISEGLKDLMYIPVKETVNVDSQFSQSPIAGLKVLSIGEGFSGLVPFLLKKGAAAQGVDLVYGGAIDDGVAGKEYMLAYQKKYSENLFFGDAQDLPDDFDSASYDLVLMHCVLESIPNEAKAIKEAFRLLKPKGELRFNLVGTFSQERKEAFEKGIAEMGLPSSSYSVDIYTTHFKSEIQGIDRAHFPYDTFDAAEFHQLLFAPSFGKPFLRSSKVV